MPKSRKKKYKKKKNPARAPQAPKQTSTARVQTPKAPKATNPAQAADPNRQRQMWIALAIALGVFLLLILVARLTGGDKNSAETTPETETVQSADEVTASGDATAQDSDSAVTASGDTTATTDSGDPAAATTASGDTTATANSGDMTTTSNTNAATNDSSASTDNATANATPDSTAATETASLQSAPAAAEYADIVVKDYGTITVELDPAAAPITVKNFADLAQSGFYDNLTFHRIMDGFMIQGGDPNGNGTGGSNETIVGEFASNGYTNNLSHTRGTISMARSPLDKDSASSQFFIVQKDSPHLDGDYAAFGHVTSGMEVVDKICADAEPVDDNGTIPADEQPIIESVTIREQ